MNLCISASDASLLAEKFGHAEQPDLVNYALFSRVANPNNTFVPLNSGECHLRCRASAQGLHIAISVCDQVGF